MKPLTGRMLREIAPGCPAAKAEDYARYLAVAMAECCIDTPLRAAAFLAQLAHECMDFRQLEELASGSDYESRLDLGNCRPGDGVRYKGRGWIQLTGRANYHAAGRALQLELEEHPELAAQPQHAARIAGWFWANGAGLRLSKAARSYLAQYLAPGSVLNLNSVADAGDFVGCTYAVNGLATTGHPSFHGRRDAIYRRALAALSPTSPKAAA